MIEAVRTSETSVNTNLTTQCYIPEDCKLHTRRCENLKSLTNSVAPEPEGLSPYSQEPASGTDPELTASTLHSPNQSP
jgi:hypothetical protein